MIVQINLNILVNVAYHCRSSVNACFHLFVGRKQCCGKWYCSYKTCYFLNVYIYLCVWIQCHLLFHCQQKSQIWCIITILIELTTLSMNTWLAVHCICHCCRLKLPNCTRIWRGNQHLTRWDCTAFIGHNHLMDKTPLFSDGRVFCRNNRLSVCTNTRSPSSTEYRNV